GALQNQPGDEDSNEQLILVRQYDDVSRDSKQEDDAAEDGETDECMLEVPVEEAGISATI
ncbi:hypothetical protein KI387_017827, partial [Taxus chinensis]